jgi:hypothetical protein
MVLLTPIRVCYTWCTCTDVPSVVVTAGLHDPSIDSIETIPMGAQQVNIITHEEHNTFEHRIYKLPNGRQVRQETIRFMVDNNCDVKVMLNNKIDLSNNDNYITFKLAFRDNVWSDPISMFSTGMNQHVPITINGKYVMSADVFLSSCGCDDEAEAVSAKDLAKFLYILPASNWPNTVRGFKFVLHKAITETEAPTHDHTNTAPAPTPALAPEVGVVE